MKIAGIKTNSFVDMKGMIAYVVFTWGCNLNCWYCHNRHIIGESRDFLDPNKVLQDIEGRKGFIDIVVISGGEPTLQADLKEFVQAIKSKGIKVKLDTNGTNPEVIKDLLDSRLLDYIAMDIKAPFNKYHKQAYVEVDIDSIKSSIDIIMASDIDYEFRTTYAPDLDENDIEEIAKSIQGAKLYVLQQFNMHENMIKKTFGAHSSDYVKATADNASKYVQVMTKGIG